MENNTTKSIDSGKELKVEMVENDKILDKSDVAFAFAIFQPEQDRELMADEKTANRKNSKIVYVKSATVRFKQFINEILNGITINLRGRLKSKSTTSKSKTAKSSSKQDMERNNE